MFWFYIRLSERKATHAQQEATQDEGELKREEEEG
jgi:hypothetical protein